MTIEIIHGQKFEITAQGFAGHDADAERAKDHAVTALKALLAEKLADITDEDLIDIGTKATLRALDGWKSVPDAAGVEIVRL